MTTEDLSEMLRERFRRAATMAEIFSLARETAVTDCTTQSYVELVQIAFGYSTGGWYMQNYTESFGNGTEPDSYLDRVLLRELVAHREQWDISPDRREPAWYDGLACRSGLQLLKTGRYPELEKIETDAVLAAHAAARRIRNTPPLTVAA